MSLLIRAFQKRTDEQARQLDLLTVNNKDGTEPMSIIIGCLIVAIGWGIYGFIAGYFVGTKTITWLGTAMKVLYCVICLKALFALDWSLIIGVPCFLAGSKAGESKSSSN